MFDITTVRDGWSLKNKLSGWEWLGAGGWHYPGKLEGEEKTDSEEWWRQQRWWGVKRELDLGGHTGHYAGLDAPWLEGLISQTDLRATKQYQHASAWVSYLRPGYLGTFWDSLAMAHMDPRRTDHSSPQWGCWRNSARQGCTSYLHIAPR